MSKAHKQELLQFYMKYDGIDDDINLICDHKLIELLTSININDINSIDGLLFAYEYKSTSPGEIEKDNFIKISQMNSIYNTKTLANYFHTCQTKLVTDYIYYKHFYQWCFSYLLEENKKQLDLEIAIELWSTLFTNKCLKYFKLKDLWLNFLNQIYDLKYITRDLWNLLLDFGHEVSDDLKKYDENAAWPVAIDEFVEYINKK